MSARMLPLAEVIADGLDSIRNGRGLSAEHVEAIKKANAADDLLAALQKLVYCRDPVNAATYRDWQEGIKAARAAIALATG